MIKSSNHKWQEHEKKEQRTKKQPESNFKNGTYSKVFIKSDESSDTINQLVNNYKASTIKVNMMDTLSSEERTNNDDYLSIMNEYLRNLREATSSE